MIPMEPSRQVAVSFGRAPGAGDVHRAVGACVVGIVPADAPSYASRLPQCVVRASAPSPDVGLEHLRLTPRSSGGLGHPDLPRSSGELGRPEGPQSALSILPNLSSGEPSRVADTTHALFRAGARSVDVLLLRAKGAGIHDFSHPMVLEQLLSWLPQLWGALITLPDLRRAAPVVTARLARALAPSARELFLLLCLDLPDGASEGAMLEALHGVDAALARWTGDPEAVAGQSWRSAAAVVAGMLAADLANPGRPLAHRPIPLPPPRRAVVDRRAMLEPRRRGADPALLDERVVRLEVDGVANVALVRSEMSLRAPEGAWPLPALFAAKYVRRTLLEAADGFVFRPVHEREAIALGGALQIAMRPFVEHGLLVGSLAGGAPTVETSVIRDPSAPGLAATVTGYLRPWMKQVSLRVNVQAGERPAVLEA